MASVRNLLSSVRNLRKGGNSSVPSSDAKGDQDFGSGMVLSPKLQAVFTKEEITVDMLEYLTDWDWENLAKRCGKGVPYGELVRARRCIQQRGISRPPRSHMPGMLGKTDGCIAKLFDGSEGCGTLIFIGEALGICAFHSVFQKESRKVLESTLSVSNQGLELKFVHPSMDLAVYRVFDGNNNDRKGPFVELDSNESIYAGNPIHLLSFSAFDSQTRDEEDDVPMVIQGHISKSSEDSFFSVGQYSSLPKSSGGAVLSNSGKLVGMHVASLYHEDHEFYKPPRSPPLKKGQIFATQHPLVIPPPDEGEDEISSEMDSNEKVNNLLQHVLINMKSKACVGNLLSVIHIRSQLLSAGILPREKKNSRTSKRRRH